MNSEGRRFKHLKSEHWIPAAVENVNQACIESIQTQSFDTALLESPSPNARSVMQWRELGTTFVVCHEIDLNENGNSYANQDVQHSSFEDTNEKARPVGSRFSHLLTQHFLGSMH